MILLRTFFLMNNNPILQHQQGDVWAQIDNTPLPLCV